MSNNLTKNDESWIKLFDKYKILEYIHEHGKFEILASQINEFREARLMTKFDNKSNLPLPFVENKLSILPITRGSYVLAPFDTFCNFPSNVDASDIIYVKFPEEIKSIRPELISSESAAISCAFLSGIINDFVQDDALLPTINGRMSSNKFDFMIYNSLKQEKMRIEVANSQIEIDGGYEGATTFSLIEAKNNFSDNFMIRQLYYPYRRWYDQIDKKVKTIFIIYSNEIYYLFEYVFQEPLNYNSLKLEKIQRYSFNKANIDLDDIQQIIRTTIELQKEPEIPFPQANSFARVINLCELLLENDLTKDAITINYGFDARQTDYYVNAGLYLGIFYLSEQVVSLTTEGKRILKLDHRNKQLAFVKLILQHKVFNSVLKLNLTKGYSPTTVEIVEIMKNSNLYNIDKDSTFFRRSSSIKAWVGWIISLIND